MANLAIVGSYAVNGVAALHTEILKNRIFSHFHKIFPGKFINITNGITPRRWLKTANPFLSNIISERIGENWVYDLNDLKKLEQFAEQPEFREAFRSAKWLTKKLLIDVIEESNGIKINPESMFDVQIKRFHEYKRQLLNVLHIITLYNRIKDNPKIETVPRTIIFAGKAARAYQMAKLIIKLINSVAEIVNNDPDVGDKLKVVKPLVRFVSFAVAGVPPELMGIGPVEAIPKSLKLAGLSQKEIGLIELNEAFASQSLAVIRELELDPEIINVNGGAIALGHPLGLLDQN